MLDWCSFQGTAVKAFQIFTAILFLSLSSQAFADVVTPAMEDAFLGKLKASIAHKDYKQFRELFYKSEEKGRWLQLQTGGPFNTIVSDSPRTYSFQPPSHITGMGGQPIAPFVQPVFAEWHKKREKLEVVRELIITFPMTVPGTAGKTASMPLIVNNGKLLVVAAGYSIAWN